MSSTASSSQQPSCGRLSPGALEEASRRKRKRPLSLRKRITTEADAEAFVAGEAEWKGLCQRSQALFSASSEAEWAELREALSLLANLVHLSRRASVELWKKKALVGAFVHLLDSSASSVGPSEGPSAQAAAARLLANLAVRRESAGRLVETQSEVLATLAEELSGQGRRDWEAKTRSQALRCLRMLALSGRWTVGPLLRIEAAAALAHLLVAYPVEPLEGQPMEEDQPEDEPQPPPPKPDWSLEELLGALAPLVRHSPAQTGRQVIRCPDFAARLLRLRFHGPSAKLALLHQIFDRLLEHSPDVMNHLAAAGLLEAIIKRVNGLKGASEEALAEATATGLRFFDCVRLLASLAHDAWGRARMQESNAISLFVEAFATTDFATPEHRAFAEHFVRFLHDTRSLEYFLFCEAFLGTMARDLEAYAEARPRRCTDAPPSYRCESPPPEPREGVASHSGFLHHQPSPPYSSPRAGAWSPAYSSTSRTSVESPPFPGSPVHSPVQSDDESGAESSSGAKRRRADSADADDAEATVAAEMRLVGWFSHTEALYMRMSSDRFLQALVTYVGRAREPSAKGVRALNRVITTPQLLEGLLHWRVDQAVARHLAGIRCERRLTCGACADATGMCESLLRHLASSLSSGFGLGLLAQEAKSPEQAKRRAAAELAFGLVEGRSHRRRLLGQMGGLDELMGALLDGSSDAASAVFVKTRNERLFASAQLVDFSQPCRVREFPLKEGCEVVEFKRPDGSSLSLPLVQLRDASAYFQGLFSGAFQDSESRCLELSGLDESARVAEAFVHFVHGCRGCDALPLSGAEAVGLLGMADVHLCRPLLDFALNSLIPASLDKDVGPALALLALSVGQPHLLSPAWLLLFRRHADFVWKDFVHRARDQGLGEDLHRELRLFLASYV